MVKYLAPSKWQIWDSNPGILVQESALNDCDILPLSVRELRCLNMHVLQHKCREQKSYFFGEKALSNQVLYDGSDDLQR